MVRKLLGGVLNWWDVVAFAIQVFGELQTMLFPEDYLVQVFGPGILESYPEAVWLARNAALGTFFYTCGVFWFIGYSAFAPMFSVKHAFDTMHCLTNCGLLAFHAASWPLFKTAVRQQEWMITMGVHLFLAIGYAVNARVHRVEGDLKVTYSNRAQTVQRGRSKSVMKKKTK
ncbi:unnamed protein product [Amoebophrya sp. A25]|nr:unnamed protein product [Amoebophrya sp. A25]|eukprot:GSA25T00022651001.1